MEGSRSAYVDMTVTETVWLGGDGLPELSGDGAVVGMFVEPLETERGAPRYPFGALRFRVLGGERARLLAGSELRPGTYRIRFFADAPSRAVLRVSAGTFVLQPGRRLTMKVSSRTSPLATGRSLRQHSYLAAVPARSHALVASRVTGTRAEQTYACATTSGRCSTALDLPVFIPSQGAAPTLSWAGTSPVVRDALVGVDGVRTSDGELTSLVLSFTP